MGSLDEVLGRIESAGYALYAKKEVSPGGSKLVETGMFGINPSMAPIEEWVDIFPEYKPDFEIRDAAKAELNQIFNESEWTSAKLAAGYHLGDYGREILDSRFKEIAHKLGFADLDTQPRFNGNVEPDRMLVCLEDALKMAELSSGPYKPYPSVYDTFSDEIIQLIEEVYENSAQKSTRICAGIGLEKHKRSDQIKTPSDVSSIEAQAYIREWSLGSILSPTELETVFSYGPTFEYRKKAADLLSLSEADIIGNEIAQKNPGFELSGDQLKQVYTSSIRHEFRENAANSLGYHQVRFLEDELARGWSLDYDRDVEKNTKGYISTQRGIIKSQREVWEVFGRGTNIENIKKAGGILLERELINKAEFLRRLMVSGEKLGESQLKIIYDSREKSEFRRKAGKESAKNYYFSRKFIGIEDIESLKLWFIEIADVLGYTYVEGQARFDTVNNAVQPPSMQRMFDRLDDALELLSLYSRSGLVPSLENYLSFFNDIPSFIQKLYDESPHKPVRIKLGVELEKRKRPDWEKTYILIPEFDMRKIEAQVYTHEWSIGNTLEPNELETVFSYGDAPEDRKKAGELLNFHEADIIGNEMIRKKREFIYKYSFIDGLESFCEEFTEEKVKFVYNFSTKHKFREEAADRLGYPEVKFLEEEMERGWTLDYHKSERKVKTVFKDGTKIENVRIAGKMLLDNGEIREAEFFSRLMDLGQELEKKQLKCIYKRGISYEHIRRAGEKLGYSNFRINFHEFF